LLILDGGCCWRCVQQARSYLLFLDFWEIWLFFDFLIFWLIIWVYVCMYFLTNFWEIWWFFDFLGNLSVVSYEYYHAKFLQISSNFFKFLQISSKSVEIWWFFEIFENFVCIISSLNCIIAYIFSMRSRNYENTTTTTLT